MVEIIIYIRVLIHRLSEFLIGWLKKLLLKLSSKFLDKEKSGKVYSGFILLQFLIVIVAFVLTTDKFRLFCDILYTTPPGALVCLTESVAAIKDHPQMTIFDVFYGDNCTWVAAGIQAILISWYASVQDDLDKGIIIKTISMILFTFASGIMLTAFVKLIIGKNGIISMVSGLKIIYKIVKCLIYVIGAGLFIINLDAAISSIIDFIFSGIIAVGVGYLLLFIIKITHTSWIFEGVLTNHYKETEEISFILLFTIGYLIWKKLYEFIIYLLKNNAD